MSGKLDQSLEEITSAQRRTGGRRSNPQRRASSRVVTAAPVGGVHKNSKPARGAATKAAPVKGQPPNKESKIIVSNLPKDVTQQQIKEYFVQSVGAIKRVELVYGPNSQSRGIANIIFSKSDGASTAFQKLNGLLVDGHPIKIEIVVGAAQADRVIQPAKTLAERTTQPKGQPKAQPKSAANNKQKGAAGKGTAGGKNAAGAKSTGNGKTKRQGRNARPAKKTAEELDSEMADYFVSNANNENAGAGAVAGAAGAAGAAPAAPAAAGDAAMEDEIM